MPEWQMHAITWGICILITVLPLTTSTYGTHANDDDWCWLQPSSRSNVGGETMFLIWLYLTFDCIIFGTFLLMLVWCFLIVRKLKSQQISPTKTIQTSLRTLFQYPLILLICYFPNAIFLVAGLNGPQKSTRMIVMYCFSTWQGGLTAIAFFINSRESRQCWWHLFRRCFLPCHLSCCCRTVEAEEPDEYDTTHIAVAYSHHNNNNSNSQLQEEIEEDFESDDAYYGREKSASSVQISMAEIKSTENPIIA
jgi:hypothetical protein